MPLGKVNFFPSKFKLRIFSVLLWNSGTMVISESKVSVIVLLLVIEMPSSL